MIEPTQEGPDVLFIIIFDFQKSIKLKSKQLNDPEVDVTIKPTYSIIRLYRTRLYRNSVYIELQSAVPSDTMFINTNDGYIETRIYRSIYHGPLNFDITGLYCTIVFVREITISHYLIRIIVIL